MKVRIPYPNYWAIKQAKNNPGILLGIEAIVAFNFLSLKLTRIIFEVIRVATAQAVAITTSEPLGPSAISSRHLLYSFVQKTDFENFL